jgi:hypothetical protein
VSELVNHLNNNCKSQWSGRVWLDVEGSQYWTGSTSKNQAWYKDLVTACKSHAKCGVYSSSSQWQAIFGSTSFTYGSDLPLWLGHSTEIFGNRVIVIDACRYAHYDNKASFSDYTKFGGWATPHAKQYVGNANVCSMGIDKNYSPAY